MNRSASKLSRRALFAAPLVLAANRQVHAAGWPAIEAEARGQTVYFNAWAGSATINAYIAWAGAELEARHGVTLVHVKIADTAEVVRRVRDELKAGRQDGSADLVWINGENFRAMKADNLLFGPFAEALPNFRFVDTEGKPTTRIDFAEAVDGLEAPWGMAQLTFFGDGGIFAGYPPRSMGQIFQFASKNAGRVTYPAPPDFHGTTFVKQVMVETIAERAHLARPIAPQAFETAAGPAFEFLDRLHPHLWRGGKQFPQSQAQLTQMLADGELLMALTFNPSEPANLVAAGRLPQTTVAWQPSQGSIGNTHFLAIPINARAKAAAQVVANFLLSPEAQSRKADLNVWGDPTVLALDKLSPAEAALFKQAEIEYPAPAVPEPHASWVPLIEDLWLERYGT